MVSRVMGGSSLPVQPIVARGRGSVDPGVDQLLLFTVQLQAHHCVSQALKPRLHRFHTNSRPLWDESGEIGVSS
jgi:hypothetical protein